MQQELILMSHLDVMISMDSSNMHLASLTNTPVISIWGATHPFAGFMGWNQDPANVIQVSLPCRPCSIYGQKKCLRGDYACLRQIQPQTITDRVEAILHHI
jgi:ADP-heptose:LPS heptosyltransferase